jgi:hypothetical protein
MATPANPTANPTAELDGWASLTDATINRQPEHMRQAYRERRDLAIQLKMRMGAPAQDQTRLDPAGEQTDNRDVGFWNWDKFKDIKLQKERAGTSIGLGALAGAGVATAATIAGAPISIPAMVAGGGITAALNQLLPQPKGEGQELASMAGAFAGGQAGRLVSKLPGLASPGAGKQLGVFKNMLAQGLAGGMEGTAYQGITAGVERAQGMDTPYFSPWATGAGALFGGGLGAASSIGVPGSAKVKDLMAKYNITPEAARARRGRWFGSEEFPASTQTRRYARQHAQWAKLDKEITTELNTNAALDASAAADLKALQKIAKANIDKLEASSGRAATKAALARESEAIHKQRVSQVYQPQLKIAEQQMAQQQADLSRIGKRLAVLREQRAQQNKAQPATGGWTEQQVGDISTREGARQTGQGTARALTSMSNEEIAAVNRIVQDEGISFMEATRKLEATKQTAAKAQAGQIEEINIQELIEDPDGVFANLNPEDPLDAQILGLLETAEKVNDDFLELQGGRMALVVESIREEINPVWLDQREAANRSRQAYANLHLPQQRQKLQQARVEGAEAERRVEQTEILQKAYGQWKEGKADVEDLFNRHPRIRGRTKKMARLAKSFEGLSKKLGTTDGAVVDEFLREISDGAKDPMKFYRETILGPNGTDFIKKFRLAHRNNSGAQNDLTDAVMEQFFLDSYNPDTNILDPMGAFGGQPTQGQGVATSGNRGMTRDKLVELFGGGASRDAKQQAAAVMDVFEALSRSQTGMGKFATGMARHMAYWTLPHAFLMMNPLASLPGLAAGGTAVMVGVGWTKLMRAVAKNPNLAGDVVHFLEYGTPATLKAATYPALVRFMVESGQPIEVDTSAPTATEAMEATAGPASGRTAATRAAADGTAATPITHDGMNSFRFSPDLGSFSSPGSSWGAVAGPVSIRFL